MLINNPSPEASKPFSGPLEQPVPEYLQEIGIGDQTQFRSDVEYAVAHYAGNFAVAIIDGEGIKKANRGGRIKGDRKVKAIAGGTQENIRITDNDELHNFRAQDPMMNISEKDTAYHLSGDECAAILYGIKNWDDMASWTYRFVSAMEQQDIQVYTGSDIHTPGQNAESIIAEADRRMEEMKEAFKMTKLDQEKRAFIQNFGSKAIEMGIDPEDLPTYIEALVTNPAEPDELK